MKYILNKRINKIDLSAKIENYVNLCYNKDENLMKGARIMRPQEKNTFIEFIKRRFSQSSHINYSICRACGGKCCKKGGCGLMTCDVPDMSVNGIKRMLDTGLYSISFFCNNTDEDVTPIPIMTARERGAGKVNNSIIRKQCALQREDGCLLSNEERPTLGLLFIPRPNENCKMLVSEMDVLVDWYPHKEIMETVVFQETGKTSRELFYQGCIEAAMQIRSKLDMNVELTSSEVDALQILEATGTIVIVFE